MALACSTAALGGGPAGGGGARVGVLGASCVGVAAAVGAELVVRAALTGVVAMDARRAAARASSAFCWWAMACACEIFPGVKARGRDKGRSHGEVTKRKRLKHKSRKRRRRKKKAEAKAESEENKKGDNEEEEETEEKIRGTRKKNDDKKKKKEDTIKGEDAPGLP